MTTNMFVKSTFSINFGRLSYVNQYGYALFTLVFVALLFFSHDMRVVLMITCCKNCFSVTTCQWSLRSHVARIVFQSWHVSGHYGYMSQDLFFSHVMLVVITATCRKNFFFSHDMSVVITITCRKNCFSVMAYQ